MPRLVGPDTLLWLLIFFGGLAVFIGAFVFQDGGLAAAGGGGLIGGLIQKWKQWKAQQTGEVAG